MQIRYVHSVTFVTGVLWSRWLLVKPSRKKRIFAAIETKSPNLRTWFGAGVGLWLNLMVSSNQDDSIHSKLLSLCTHRGSKPHETFCKGRAGLWWGHMLPTLPGSACAFPDGFANQPRATQRPAGESAVLTDTSMLKLKFSSIKPANSQHSHQLLAGECLTDA